MNSEVGIRAEAPNKMGRLKIIAEFFRAKPLGAVGGTILLVMMLIGIFAPFMPLQSPNWTNVTHERLLSPSLAHLAGTDHLGRDQLSRIIYGGRISLYVGLLATLIGSIIGALLGMASGYSGGKFDTMLQRVMDTIMGFPVLMLALAYQDTEQRRAMQVSERQPDTLPQAAAIVAQPGFLSSPQVARAPTMIVFDDALVDRLEHHVRLEQTQVAQFVHHPSLDNLYRRPTATVHVH